MITVGHYLLLAALLFSIGLVGVLTRKSAVTVFMCIELMLNAGNLVWVALARHMGDPGGMVFVFFVLAVSAAEAAVGFALIVAFVRKRKTSDLDAAHFLRW